MQIAVDRHRFSRCIKQTELSLGDIFADVHREKMLCYINKMCDAYCFLVDRIGQTRVVQVNNFITYKSMGDRIIKTSICSKHSYNSSHINSSTFKHTIHTTIIPTKTTNYTL